MTQYYSRTDTVYSGSAVISIPFSYISKDDISVIILRDDEEIAATFTWQNASQINITTELQTGDVISVRRHTPIDEKIVTYTDESMILDDNNLNLSQDQLLDAVQEIWDNGLDVTAISSEAITKADTALATANSADSKADNAVSTANTASSNASTALSNSQTALSNSQTAVSTANSASDAATYASNKVDAFGEDIATVIAAAEEIEALEEAVTTATNAADTATNAAETATTAAQALQNIKTVNSTSLLGGGNVEVADLSLSNLNATGQDILNNKADVNLSNLSSTGEKHFLNKQQITNCLLEVPNRIQYTLVDGVFTLKAGSVVIVPYGTTDLSSTINVGDTFIHPDLKVYDTYWDSTNNQFFVWAELQNDVTRGATAGGAYAIRTLVLYFSSSTISIANFSLAQSVTSDASASSTSLFYNTTENLVKTKSSGTVTDYTGCLPIAKSITNATYSNSAIRQVFNGIGYIGTAFWVDKGVKALMPNGFNSDGSLNNTEYTQANFNINTFSSIGNGQKILRLVPSVERLSYDGVAVEYYDINTNYNRLTSNNSIATKSAYIGNFIVTDNVITSFMVDPVLNINSMCDGGWVDSNLTIASNVNAPSSGTPLEYDLSSYLPIDGNNYEVILTGAVTTGTTSGNTVSLRVYSNILNIYQTITTVQTRSSSSVSGGGTLTLPVGLDKKIYVSSYAGNNGTFSLLARGYRRLGTNA